ncbi:hypothetical protein [Paenibacillus sp. NRS-1760]|uniref:hypothetical protein n=1 Tax=Paenibacillus sp. NRS-1760 TaxID=3233902 RepID=UPI003D2A460E
MGTTIPKRANEKGSEPSPVKTTKLSPEEMEREMERLNKGRPVLRNRIIGKERELKVKPTKEAYLKALCEGKSTTKIETMFGITAAGLGYWLGEWGLKDSENEKAALEAYLRAQNPPANNLQSQDDKGAAKGKRGPAPKDSPSCGLTKQVYIEQIAAGETNASIERAWSMKQNSLYEWINRWGLKGLKPERAHELLNSESTQEVIPVTGLIKLNELNEINALKAEIEQLRLSSKAIEEMQEKINALELESMVWEEKANNIKTELINCTSERDQAIKRLLEIERTQAASDSAPEYVAPVATQAFVSFALPLIHITEEPGIKRDRALERICDLTDRVTTGDIDYPRLAKETLELLQVVISLVHSQTHDLTVKPEKVSKRVMNFLAIITACI